MHQIMVKIKIYIVHVTPLIERRYIKIDIIDISMMIGGLYLSMRRLSGVFEESSILLLMHRYKRCSEVLRCDISRRTPLSPPPLTNTTSTLIFLLSLSDDLLGITGVFIHLREGYLPAKRVHM